jgi:hypothetical protein
LAKNDGHKDKKAKPRLQRQKGKDNVQTVAAAVKDELKNIDDGEKAKTNKQKGKYDALRMTAKSQRWDQWWGKDNNGANGKKGWPQRRKGKTTAAKTTHKQRQRRQTRNPKDGDCHKCDRKLVIFNNAHSQIQEIGSLN